MSIQLNSKIFILLWVCSIYCTPICFAQYFQRTCDIDGNADFAFHVAETNDGNLLILGGCEYGFPRPTVFCMKISADGSRKMDSSFITDPVQSYYTSGAGTIRKLNYSKGYLLNLTRQTPSTPPYYNSTEYGIARLDTNGKVLFTKFYTDTNIYVGDVYDVEVMPDGGYLLGGYRIERSTGMRESLLIRTDGMGNKIWEKVYRRSVSQNTIYSLELLPDNRILAGMYIATLIQLPSGGNTYYRNIPRFVLLDTSGNVLKDVIWSQSYSNNDIHFAGGGPIRHDKNGGYFHWGGLDSISGRDMYPFTYLAHLDSNFNADWIKIFDSEHKGIIVPWSTIQLKDSNYLFISTYTEVTTGTQIGWAAKIDKNGTILWQHDYTLGASDAYLTKAIERDNGTIVMVGMYRGGQPFYEQDAFIVSVDSNGCLQPGCDPTAVEEVAVKENNVAIYPNPTYTGNITVRAGESGNLYLYNIQGQMVGEYALNAGNTTLELGSRLSPGVYTGKIVYSSSITPVVVRLIYQP